MSSEYSFIAWLVSIQTNLYRFGGPVLMGVGTVSCILSVIVFTKKNLRKNPCSIYFIAFNISNFLLIFTSILFSTMANGYNIDPTLYNLTFCHFRFYGILLFDILSPSYLILASIDRILITSRNALTRQRSTRRLVFICIISITLFWMLFHIHALILTNYIQLAPGYIICYFQPGVYLMLMNYYSSIIKGILIPLLIIILALWIVKNVRSRPCIAPVSIIPTAVTTAIKNVRAAGHSRNRQIFQILLTDISIYVILNLILTIIVIYEQFNPNQSGDLVVAHIQVFLMNVGVFSGYIPFCIGCYTNSLASKSFRHEVKNIFKLK